MIGTLTKTPWLSFPKPNPQARLRLFCFPYAGGAASVYYAWPGRLPPTVELCPFQLPGRGARSRETPFTGLDEVVEASYRDFLPYLDKPFAFFGHSMGALLGFEFARRLQGHYGISPLHLFVSGRGAPHLPDTDTPRHLMPDPELLDELRRLKGTPQEILDNPELLQLMLPLLRADFSICETYVHRGGVTLDCPLTALGGLEDEDVSRDSLEQWRDHTSAAFSLRMFPGGHFFLHSAEGLLLQILYRELYRLAGAPATGLRELAGV